MFGGGIVGGPKQDVQEDEVAGKVGVPGFSIGGMVPAVKVGGGDHEFVGPAGTIQIAVDVAVHEGAEEEVDEQGGGGGTEVDDGKDVGSAEGDAF